MRRPKPSGKAKGRRTTDVDTLLTRLKSNGYQVRKTPGSSHVKIRDASGHLVAVTSSNPGDPRGLLNFQSVLRRAGVAL